MGEEYKRKKKMPPNYKKSFLLTNTFTKQKAKEQLYGALGPAALKIY